MVQLSKQSSSCNDAARTLSNLMHTLFPTGVGAAVDAITELSHDAHWMLVICVPCVSHALATSLCPLAEWSTRHMLQCNDHFSRGLNVGTTQYRHLRLVFCCSCKVDALHCDAIGRPLAPQALPRTLLWKEPPSTSFSLQLSRTAKSARAHDKLPATFIRKRGT